MITIFLKITRQFLIIIHNYYHRAICNCNVRTYKIEIQNLFNLLIHSFPNFLFCPKIQLQLIFNIFNLNQNYLKLSEWLGFSSEYLEQWIKLSDGFMTWVHTKFHKDEIDQRRGVFPSIWKSYLSETQQSDEIVWD